MASHADHHPPHSLRVVKDPVCGMDVDPAQSVFASEHEGEWFRFCSGRCKGRFDANPTGFVHTDHITHDASDRSEHADVPSRDRFRSSGRGGVGVDVPDAPRDPAVSPRVVPDLRDGAWSR